MKQNVLANAGQHSFLNSSGDRFWQVLKILNGNHQSWPEIRAFPEGK